MDRDVVDPRERDPQRCGGGIGIVLEHDEALELRDQLLQQRRGLDRFGPRLDDLGSRRPCGGRKFLTHRHGVFAQAFGKTFETSFAVALRQFGDALELLLFLPGLLALLARVIGLLLAPSLLLRGDDVLDRPLKRGARHAEFGGAHLNPQRVFARAGHTATTRRRRTCSSVRLALCLGENRQRWRRR